MVKLTHLVSDRKPSMQSELNLLYKNVEMNNVKEQTTRKKVHKIISLLLTISNVDPTFPKHLNSDVAPFVHQRRHMVLKIVAKNESYSHKRVLAQLASTGSLPIRELF